MFNTLTKIVDLGQEKVQELLERINIQNFDDAYHQYTQTRFFGGRFGITNQYGDGPRHLGVEYDGQRFSLHLWNKVAWFNKKINTPFVPASLIFVW